jgi:hypothetical protein
VAVAGPAAPQTAGGPSTAVGRGGAATAVDRLATNAAIDVMRRGGNAVDGAVIRSFDPLLYDDPTPWDGPPLPEESGLDFGSLPMAAAFACAERLTRFSFTSDLLDDHGDWIALGHNPLHSLSAAASWPPDEANAERQLCEDHPRRQSLPNRLFWDAEVCDARQLFLPGWIGWAQFLLCVLAAAPVVALRIAAELQLHVGTEYFDHLSFLGNPPPLHPSLLCARYCPQQHRTDDWPRA